MQTQLDLSLTDSLIFHSINVGLFTFVSSITLFTNNVPSSIAIGIVFIYKVFVLMDGLCLIFMALIKYLLIFHGPLLEIYNEQKIRLSLLLSGFTLSVFLCILDIESFKITDGFYPYLTGIDSTPNEATVAITTKCVYGLVAILHLALICRIEAQSYSLEEGVLYLVVKNENGKQFASKRVFHRLSAFMFVTIFTLWFVYHIYMEEIIQLMQTYLPSPVGYIRTLSLIQFFFVDIILIIMLSKNRQPLRALYNDFKNQYSVGPWVLHVSSVGPNVVGMI